jgi:hypothetical protein
MRLPAVPFADASMLLQQKLPKPNAIILLLHCWLQQEDLFSQFV